MKKLLHERLREAENKTDIISFVGDGYSFALWPREAKALAAEIEGDYISLPRDQDGKPWKIGDPVRPLNATSDSHVTGYIYDGEEWYLKYRWAGIDGKNSESVTYCKRPQPKVLDADDVEIKVGDTVYVIGGADDGKRLVAQGFEYCDSGEVYVSCGERSICGILRSPSDLTHKEPDSLEKLRDEMSNACSSMAQDWADRLSAIIERGA